MKKVITSDTFMTVVAVVCLWFSFIPIAHDFASSSHHIFKMRRNDLIKQVHEDHWDIGYEYADDCLPDNQPKAKDLEEAITEALQVWLQPLRDMKTQKPIVNTFHFKVGKEAGAIKWEEADLIIQFYCGKPQGRSRGEGVRLRARDLSLPAFI